LNILTKLKNIMKSNTLVVMNSYQKVFNLYLIELNELFIEYANHLITNNNKPFISSSFIDITFAYLPLAFSILELPILPNKNK